jgi:proton-coupled amino acid transporter
VTFPDIGGTLYGPWMRYMILGSIVVSQIGFVAAYTIFVAQNLQVPIPQPFSPVPNLTHAQAFVMGITHCAKLIAVQYFILMQLVVFLPLVLIRDLAKLSTTALIADVFILGGLVYIFGSEFSIISKRGIADVKLFNPRDFPLFIGCVVGGVGIYAFLLTF